MKEKDFKNLQRSTYLDLAKNFDTTQRRENRNHINKIKAISDFLQVRDGEKILEIGVGTGIHAKYLLDWNTPNFNFYGVDLSEDMLFEASSRLSQHENFYLEVMDGENLAFKDNSFDKVYISGSLHHYFDLNKGISELLRVLKNGGRFCIMEPNYFFPSNIFAAHLKKEEYSMRFIKKGNLHRWLSHNNVDYEILNFAYTPPYPKKFIKIYDIVDYCLGRAPLLRNISVMLLVRGVKRGN